MTIPHSPSSTESERPYVMIPRKLVPACGKNTLAIGLFTLMVRLNFIHQIPIPLSAADIKAYDPTLTRGAILRALDRLEQLGYLIKDTSRRKTSYTPTWGKVNQEPVAYDRTAPSLGKPKHIEAIRVDRDILDVAMGRLEPQHDIPAPISRYTSAPLIGLRDVGAYAAGQATNALRAWGLIDAGGTPQPIDPKRLLTDASQHHILHPGGIKLTAEGCRHLGLPVQSPPPAPTPTPDTRYQMIFIEHDIKLNLNALHAEAPPPDSNPDPGRDRESSEQKIDELIDSASADQHTDTSSHCGKLDTDHHNEHMTGNQGIQGKKRDSGNPPPSPPNGEQEEEEGAGRQACSYTPEPDNRMPIREQQPIAPSKPALPDTLADDSRSRQLLQAHRVHPNLQAQFAAINPATLAASLYELDATGSGIGAIISRWKVEPPQPDAADEQALAVAPADWSAEQVATLASFLRDGLPPTEAMEATRDWTRPGARARQETALADRDRSRRRHGPPRSWHERAPRRAERAQPDAAGQNEAARWVETHAPAEFDAAMRETMRTMYQKGLRDANDVIISTRMFHERLARQGRTTGVYA